MWALAPAVFLSLAGLMIVAFTLRLLVRGSRTLSARLGSPRMWGQLSIVAAGLLLLIDGQYKMVRVYHAPMKRLETIIRLQEVLQEPLDALQLQVHGPDPFRPETGPRSLRLQAKTKTAQEFVSEIAPELFNQDSTARPDNRINTYWIPWHSLVEHATTPEGRALAAKVDSLNAFRQLSGIEFFLVSSTALANQVPERLVLNASQSAVLKLFVSEEPAVEAEGDPCVAAYRDVQAVGDRMAAWETALLSAEAASHNVPVDFLAVGLILLAVGVLLAFACSPTSAPTGMWVDSLRSLLDEMRPLSVTGLALFLMSLNTILLHVDSAPISRFQYLTLGTVFPLLLIVGRFGPATRFFRRAAPALAVFGVVVCTWALITHLYWYATAIAILQWCFTWAPGRQTICPQRKNNLATPLPTAEAGPGEGLKLTKSARVHEREQRPWGALVVNLFTSVIVWTILLQLLPHSRGDGVHPFAGSPGTEWILGPELGPRLPRLRYSIPVFVLSLFLVLPNVFYAGAGRRVTSFPHRRGTLVANLVAVAGFAFAAFLADGIDYVHWRAVLAPADDVRHGGWLLWNVPSLYGFLNVLTLAVFPTESLWKNLYVMNSSLTLLSAILLFFTLRLLRPGPLNWCFSVALTVTAVFLLPGWLEERDGATILVPDAVHGPMLGAYRYIWCYVLLAILIWDFRRVSEGKPTWMIRWLGCLAWLAGSLWSFESAIFSATIWLPAYVLTLWRDAVNANPGRRKLMKAIRSTALWALLPPCLLLVTLGAVTAYYKRALGAGPDWSVFIEGARGGTGDLTPEGVGPWIWFIVFCAISSAAAYLLFFGSLQTLSLGWGAWAILWATSSYYMARAIPGIDLRVLLAMSPMICASFAVAAFALNEERLEKKWQLLFKTSAMAVMTILIVAGVGNAPAFLARAADMKIGYKEIERQLPSADSAALSLLELGGVREKDAVAFYDDPVNGLALGMLRRGNGQAPTFPGRRDAWLPLESWEQLELSIGDGLTHDRMRVFVQRTAAHVRSGGYLLIAKKSLPEAEKWLLGALRATYIPTEVAESRDYKLIRYDLGPARDLRRHRSDYDSSRHGAGG